MQTQIEQITNAIKDIRNTIAEEGGQISESTVLENYPDAIKSIPKVTHNMQQQIFIFYCYAKNVSEALKKSTPTITWNDDKGYIVSGEDEYNWNRDVELLKKEMSSGEERRLFVRILILRYEDNIENIDWPIPMPIEGIQGPQGKSGRDGKDGIVAGMRQFLAAPIFKIVSKNQVETELKDTIDVEYDHDQIAQYNIPYPEYIKIDGNLINETVTERSNGWGLNFNFENSANQKDYAVLKRIVSYGNLNDMATSVSDPVLLSGDRVIDQTIWYITDSNSSLAPEFSKETWSETVPTNFYNENNTYDYLWMCVETKYSSGSTVYTDPVCILKKPNSIVSTTNLYGVSSNVSSEPSAWLPFNKVPENYDVLWQRTTTNFKWSDSNVECRPIAIKGAPGVSPITVLASVDSSDLESWTLAHTTIDLQSAIIVNKETYVWNGTTDPSNITSNYVSVSDENNTYYWINLGKWAADSFPDWNVNNPESTGYIANRTHYFTRNQQHYTERITSDDGYRFYLYCSRPDNIDNAFNFRVNDVYADWFTIDNTVDDPNWIVAYLNDDPERTVQINRNVNEWFEVECLVRGGNADYTEEYTGKEITLSIKWDVLKKLDPMFVPQMIEITYDELCVLRNESQLIPGMQ